MMNNSRQPEERFSAPSDEKLDVAPKRVLDESDLDSALQLLVERAQYVTGATGIALALPHSDEMVCRASAGASAPAVGARLQVQSGLTGESVALKQPLCCDNTEDDPRVNLETCQSLGIASMVVLPLLRGNGEVRGLLELFSDHAYAFEERDLIALERMADLISAALDLAEQRPAELKATTLKATANEAAPPDETMKEYDLAAGEGTTPQAPGPARTAAAAARAAFPDAMQRVQRCSSCGFPVSEGRTACLDCETKPSGKRSVIATVSTYNDHDPNNNTRTNRARTDDLASETNLQQRAALAHKAPVPKEEEYVPRFLADAQPVHESWLANHVNLLAVAVIALGIVVAVVVFR